MNLGGKMAENFDLETVAMTLIGHAGESKSLAYQALYEAKKGNFEEAQTLYINFFCITTLRF